MFLLFQSTFEIVIELQRVPFPVMCFFLCLRLSAPSYLSLTWGAAAGPLTSLPPKDWRRAITFPFSGFVFVLSMQRNSLSSSHTRVRNRNPTSARSNRSSIPFLSGRWTQSFLMSTMHPALPDPCSCFSSSMLEGGEQEIQAQCGQK